MIRCIETVSSRYDRKNIYIWGVNRYSVQVFTYLAFRELDIRGFVVDNERFAGQCFMNREVISTQTAKERNAIVIVSDECKNLKFIDGLQMIYYHQCLALDCRLRNKKIVLYGAGNCGEMWYRKLKEKGMAVEAFCVTKKDKMSYLGKRVLTVDEIPRTDDYAVLICTEVETYKNEMLKNLMEINIPYIYINEFIEYWDILLNTFFQSIHKAVQENRNIYIYTEKLDAGSELLCSVLNRYGIKVRGYVYKEKNNEIENVYDLAYEDLTKVFVIVNEFDRAKMQDALETLEEIGLCMERFEYAGLRIIEGDSVNRRKVGFDFLLEQSVCDSSIPGVEIHGPEKEEDIRIVILGGSTSADRALRPKSWPSFLYSKLKDKGINVTIYNCAHCSHDVVKEVLRFIRDGWYLKPDYVISMSGVNNLIKNITESNNQFNIQHVIEMGKTLHPDGGNIYGIEVEEDTFDFWVRMERVLNGVVNAYGGKLFAFLQPMKTGKPDHSLIEESIHEVEGFGKYELNFRKKAEYNDFYINLLSLFDDREEMFVDACHYSTKGNSILADVVCNILLNDISRK